VSGHSNPALQSDMNRYYHRGTKILGMNDAIHRMDVPIPAETCSFIPHDGGHLDAFDKRCATGAEHRLYLDERWFCLGHDWFLQGNSKFWWELDSGHAQRQLW
jgi:hypothetical protein